MLSIIVYGRNDNHGNNLDKRVSLSLNNFAHFLNEDDEIIFVDWNSPRNLKTFPERIADTLTPKCKQILKVIKVDESIHRSLAAATQKPTIEPIARNVGILRSSLDSKWILSTNTDMIFLQKNETISIRNKIQELEAGYYAIPRYEIPEYIWELFDRVNPEQTIKEVEELSKIINLKYLVNSNYYNRYDAPGDFQLFLKSDALKIRGFDERMIWGWHVDSNLARRLNLLYGETKSLSEFLEGYHCNHSTVKTHYTAGAQTNSEEKFITSLINTDANHDATWGLKNYDLPILKLNNSRQKSRDYLNSNIQTQQVVSEINTYDFGYLKSREINSSSLHLLDYLQGSKVNDLVVYVGENNAFFSKTKGIADHFGLEVLRDDGNLTLENEIKKSSDLGHHIYFLLDFSIEQKNGKNNQAQIDEEAKTVIAKNIDFLFNLAELVARGLIKVEDYSISTHFLDYLNSYGLVTPILNFSKLAGAYSGVREVKLKDSFIHSSIARKKLIYSVISLRQKIYLSDTGVNFINSRLVLVNDITVGSHEIRSMLNSEKGLAKNFQGSKIKDGDKISLNPKINKKNFLTLLELDYPHDTHSFPKLRINSKSEIKENTLNMVITSRQSIVFVINSLEEANIQINYSSPEAKSLPEHYKDVPLVRMTNLTFFDRYQLAKKRFYWASHPISALFFRNGWSFSNEMRHRQSVNESMEIDLSYAPKNSKKIYVCLFSDQLTLSTIRFSDKGGILLTKYPKMSKLFLSPRNTIYSIDILDKKNKTLNLFFDDSKTESELKFLNKKFVYAKFIYFSKFNNPIIDKIIINYKYIQFLSKWKLKDINKSLNRRILIFVLRFKFLESIADNLFGFNYFVLMQRKLTNELKNLELKIGETLNPPNL